MRNWPSTEGKAEVPLSRALIMTLGALLSIIFLAVIIYVRWEDFVWAFRWSNAPQLLLLMAIHVILLGLNGLSLASFTAHFGVRLEAVEWCGLPAVTAFTNLASPLSGGLIIRGGYLRQRYGLPVTAFASLTGGYYVIAYAVISLIVLAILGVRVALGDAVAWPVLLGIAGIAGALIAVMALPLDRLALLVDRARLLRAGGRVLRGWQTIRTDPKLIRRQTLIMIGSQIMRALSLVVALSAFRVRISFFDSVLVMSLASLSIIFRLTPGGLGLVEGLTGLGYGLIGGDAVVGISASVLSRAASLPVVIVLGLVFVRILTRRLLNMSPVETH